MTALLPSIVFLGAIFALSLYLAFTRHIVSGKDELIARVSQIYPFAVILQALHFLEELMTGFADRFPGVFGLEPMSRSAFLGFNLAWLAVWLIAIPGIASRNRLAYAVAWFLALAGALNLIAHPLLALYSGGYFPGLISAPLLGIVCVFLFLRLEVATRPD